MGPLKYLTAEEKELYVQNGFIKLNGIFTDAAVESISNEYDDLFERKNKENARGLEAAWVGYRGNQEAGYTDYTVKSIHNLQMQSAEFTKAIMNANLLDAIEDLLGTENILLHHTKAHLKPPENGAPFPIHQDYPYFPFKNHTMLAVFLHLDDTTPENGGLAVYPGSHKFGPLEDKGVTDKEGRQYHYVDQEKFPLSGATPISAKKGCDGCFLYNSELQKTNLLEYATNPRHKTLFFAERTDTAVPSWPPDLILKVPIFVIGPRSKDMYYTV